MVGFWIFLSVVILLVWFTIIEEKQTKKRHQNFKEDTEILINLVKLTLSVIQEDTKLEKEKVEILKKLDEKVKEKEKGSHDKGRKKSRIGSANKKTS